LQQADILSHIRLKLLIIAVGDRMFLRMQDFDFCPNLIKFYPNFPKIYPDLAQFMHIYTKFNHSTQICQK